MKIIDDREDMQFQRFLSQFSLADKKTLSDLTGFVKDPVEIVDILPNSIWESRFPKADKLQINYMINKMKE